MRTLEALVGSGCLRAARIVAILIAPTAAIADDAPVLALPIACEPGLNCFVQNYVDADPSPSAKDYRCGTLTYDGHNGTDFRLPSVAAQQDGVEVLAAAPGRVLRRRDGIADISVREAGAATVKDAECGNGVVIEHAAGWQTQYCHLARGSLRVEIGDRVEARQAIGRVGLSGLTEYPHLHFIVRHRGEIVDPFAHAASPSSCGGGRMLWEPSLRQSLTYQPRRVLNSGFAASSVTMAALETGELGQQPGIDAPALVAFARGIGLKAGDVASIILSDPSGKTLAEQKAKPLERNQAQYLVFAGLRKPAAGWPKGTYLAKFRVSQDGKSVLERNFEIELR